MAKPQTITPEKHTIFSSLYNPDVLYKEHDYKLKMTSTQNYVIANARVLAAALLCRRGRLVVFPHPAKLISSTLTSMLLKFGTSGLQTGATTTAGEGSTVHLLLPLVPFLLVVPPFH